MLKDAFVLDGPTAIGRTVRCANLALYRQFSKERAKRAKTSPKPRGYAMKRETGRGEGRAKIAGAHEVIGAPQLCCAPIW